MSSPEDTTFVNRSGARSPVSADDSGYGSLGGGDSGETTEPTVSDRSTHRPGYERTVPGPQDTRRKFDGQFVFEPCPEQVKRYNEIIQALTQPLNTCLQKRHNVKLGKPRPRRVDAVRLVVLGDTLIETDARPYIVFFCSKDLQKLIKGFLSKHAYRELFEESSTPGLSFAYKIIPSGISLKRFEAEIPDPADPQPGCSPSTNCGTPIRLYNPNAGSTCWKRATLGGILKVVQHRGTPEYYGMTAGHLLDDWIESENDRRQVEAQKDDLNSAWDFRTGRRFQEMKTAGTGAIWAQSKYMDWAIFKMEDWKMNIVDAQGLGNDPMSLCLEFIEDIFDREYDGSPTGTVRVITASRGTIPGFIQPSVGKIAIAPGAELIDTYIVSLSGTETSSINNGDSGSWVVLAEENRLVGHVVAADILGDIYVLPITDTLLDMKEHLWPLSFSLPTQEDHPEHCGQSFFTISDDVERLLKKTELILSGIEVFTPRLQVDIRQFTLVIRHLASELQDPKSLLNAGGEPGISLRGELWAILSDCRWVIEEIQEKKLNNEIPSSMNAATPPRAHLRQDDMGHILSIKKGHIDALLERVQLQPNDEPGRAWETHQVDQDDGDRTTATSLSGGPSAFSGSTKSSRSTLLSSTSSLTWPFASMEYITNVTTAELIGMDKSEIRHLPSQPAVLGRAAPSSNETLPNLGRLAPDGRGNEILPDATWTVINRRIVSPETLEQAGVRYEARPGFVAVLGLISKAKILKWARDSTNNRYARGALPNGTSNLASDRGLQLINEENSETDVLSDWEEEGTMSEDSDLPASPTSSSRKQSENDIETRDRSNQSIDELSSRFGTSVSLPGAAPQREPPASKDSEKSARLPPNPDQQSTEEQTAPRGKEDSHQSFIGRAATSLLELHKEAERDL